MVGASSEVIQAFLLALRTALATGLGALPFVFVEDFTRKWLGASNAIAGASCSRPASA